MILSFRPTEGRAGIHIEKTGFLLEFTPDWIPAFAGMTDRGQECLPCKITIYELVQYIIELAQKTKISQADIVRIERGEMEPSQEQADLIDAVIMS